MSAICVEKIYHKDCGEHKVQVFLNEDGTYSGYCFALGKFVPNPYEDKPPAYKPNIQSKSPEEIQREIEEIHSYPVVDLPERKLKKEYLDYFNIKIGVSEEDGETPILHYYPYTKDGALVGYKVRLIENKRMWSIGNQKDVEPFGWQQALQAGGKRLFICEGEMDAVAFFQICKEENKHTQWAALNPAVISLSHGASGSLKDLAPFRGEIVNQWSEIVIIMDSDEAGKEATNNLLTLFPKAFVAKMPEKDVNDCLIKGRAKAAYQAARFVKSTPKNTRIVSGWDVHEAAKEQTPWGFPWPWKGLNERTRGIRLGETIYLGAGQKQGKSEIVNTLAAYFMKEFGWKVFLAKPEEENKKSYKLVAGKIGGHLFHDPKVDFDEEAYDLAGEIIKDKLFMLDLYQHVDWETLEGDIRAAAAEGVKAVFIDPITNLTNGMSAAQANEKLQEVAQSLSALALDLNIVVFIFCHLRNPENGPPHERGGKVLSSQFAGSRAMARSCNLMLGLEGNRDPDLSKEEQNIRHLVILENREFGEVGTISLYWNSANGLFTEM